MGMEDWVISYSGGASFVFEGDTNFELMDALKSMEYWAAHNGCEVIPFIQACLSSTLGSSAIFYDYKECAEGKIVEHYAIVGGEHNARGTENSDDESVSDISFDFIKRVEINAGSTRAPTVAPPLTTNTPTKAPSPGDVTSSCVDDSSWVGELNAYHTCSFVAAIYYIFF
eukprot:scaffold133551_cov67-Attheya_sp.AAC.1